MNNTKVGIITFHSVLNYGSALQAVALQNVLEDMGMEAEIIDYRPISPEKARDISSTIKKIFSYSAWKKQILYRLFAKQVGFEESRKMREKKYETFFSENMKLSERCTMREELIHVSEKYDYLVCGSDQIWNPNYLGGNYAYFLDFCDDKNKKIAYAPSIAVDVIKDQDKKQFVRCVRDFNYISVREKSSVNLLKKVAGVVSEVVLDPTMLASEDIYKKYKIDYEKEGPYILSYFLGQNTDYKEAVLELQRLTGYRILNIPHMHLWSAMEYYGFGDEQLIDVGPGEFLSLVNNAEYICTDSFHGSVFSILYEKKFFAFRRYKDESVDSENSRIYHLLEMVGLEDRLIYSAQDMKDELGNPIDFISVKKKINEKKITSYQFLCDAFGADFGGHDG